MPDDLDDDFVPDLDDNFVPDIGDDNAIELEQSVLPTVALKKRKRREKEQQSKVHSLFFIFFSFTIYKKKRKLAKVVRPVLDSVADQSPVQLAGYLAEIQAKTFPNHTAIELSDLEISGMTFFPLLSYHLPTRLVRLRYCGHHLLDWDQDS